MHVAIDATALGSGRGGDETALVSLLEGLAEVVTPDDTTARFSVYTRRDAPVPVALGNRRQTFQVRHVAFRSRVLHYAVGLPCAVLGEWRRPELLYSITHAPPVSPAPVVLQVFDLSFRHHPEFYPLRTRVRLNLLVPLHARRAKAVITSSSFSRNDLVASYNLSPEQVFVVPLSVRPPLHVSAPERSDCLTSLGLRQPFFLYVGNLHPRKNVVRLIEAFGRARRACAALAHYQLAIVGAAWWHAGAAERAAAGAAPPGAVVLAGRVSNQQRDVLLHAAEALAYPSLFEGFGLPPLEAMAAGTPVVAAAAAALPEVLGNAALFVDPYDINGLAGALVRIATDDGLRRELRSRGRARAAEFSVRQTGMSAMAAFRAAACLG